MARAKKTTATGGTTTSKTTTSRARGRKSGKGPVAGSSLMATPPVNIPAGSTFGASQGGGVAMLTRSQVDTIPLNQQTVGNIQQLMSALFLGISPLQQAVQHTTIGNTGDARQYLQHAYENWQQIQQWGQKVFGQ